MRIVRFDAEVAYSRPGDTDEVRVGSLLGEHSDVRIDVAYLPAGVSRELASVPTRRLVAVVSGDAWAAGVDGRIRHLPAGYAAVFESIERGSFGATSDVTAVVAEGVFDVWAVAVTKEIIVSDYDPAWASWFLEIRDRVWPAVSEVAVRVDHVGSTAVPGLAAKPVIDLDVVVASTEDVTAAIAALAGCGYRWKGDLGVAGREAFSADDVRDLPAHHLYLVVDQSRPHLDHVLLRDLLLRDEAAREAYGSLKKRNAVDADDDMDIYVAAKASLVAELLTRARREAGLPAVDYWEPPSGHARDQ